MSRWLNLSRRLHRRLVRAFPHEFRLKHGDELEQMGDDALPFVWKHYGTIGVLRVLIAAAFGVVVEYASEFRQDLRYALRRLAATPAFTALAVLSLTLCIGMASLYPISIAGFERPAPGIGDHGELASPMMLVPYPHYEEYAKHDDLFSASAAYLGPTQVSVGEVADRRRAPAHLVTLDYFSTLRAIPAAGRFFDPATDGPGTAPVVVVSDGFAQRRLGGISSAVGSIMRINGEDATVIGVASEGFRGAFPRFPGELFIPLSVGPEFAPELRGGLLQDDDAQRFRPLFRLADGVTLREAEAALQVMTRNLESDEPKESRISEQRTIEMVRAGVAFPLTRQARAVQYSFAVVMFVMVLGIACANLAVFLLARGTERRKETAVRLSVGASRLRLVRQQLTESLTLSSLGGACGALFAWQLQRMANRLQLTEMEGVDWTSQFGLTQVLIIMAVSAVAGLAFGLAPALSAVRGEFLTALKQGGQGRVRRYSRLGLRNQFMLFQVASSLTLLLLTGYVLVGYQQINNHDVDFETTDLYLATVDPAHDGYSAEDTGDLLNSLEPKLEAIPEIRSAAVSLDLPFSKLLIAPQHRVTVDDGEEQAVHRVYRQRISAGYFDAIDTPVVLGRDFDRQDQVAAEEGIPSPAILNATGAERLFGRDDILGETLRDGSKTYQIVGVAKDLKSGLMMTSPTPTLYVPLTADDLDQSAATLMVRGRFGTPALEATTEFLAADQPHLTLFDPRSFDQDSERFGQLIRHSSMMNGGLATFGFLLSVVGLFSVTVHAVARRRKEIGVRVALGAKRRQVLGLVLREGVALVTVGGVLGFGAAYALSRAFSSAAERLAEMFDVGMGDPLFTVFAPVAWASLAILACYLPARRALQINPANTLRSE